MKLVLLSVIALFSLIFGAGLWAYSEHVPPSSGIIGIIAILLISSALSLAEIQHSCGLKRWPTLCVASVLGALMTFWFPLAIPS